MAVIILPNEPYGNNPTYQITFQQNNVNTDPSSAVVKLTDPKGVKSLPTLTHVGAGVYTFTLYCNVSGTWSMRCYAPLGSGAASVSAQVTVDDEINP